MNAMARRGKVLGALEQTHESIDRELRRFETALVGLRFEGKHSIGKNLTVLRDTLDYFEQHFLHHIGIEEKELFPMLIEASPMLEPCVGLLRSEHHELKLCLKKLRLSLSNVSRASLSPARRLQGIETFKEAGRYFAELLRTHVREEIVSVYRVAGRIFPRRIPSFGK